MDWLTTFAKGHCTMWFSRIYNVVIDDLCYDHDAAYDVGDIRLKFKADHALAQGVWQRSSRADTKTQVVVIKTVAIFMYLAVSTLGWIAWGKVKLGVSICNV